MRRRKNANASAGTEAHRGPNEHTKPSAGDATQQTSLDVAACWSQIVVDACKLLMHGHLDDDPSWARRYVFACYMLVAGYGSADELAWLLDWVERWRWHDDGLLRLKLDVVQERNVMRTRWSRGQEYVWP